MTLRSEPDAPARSVTSDDVSSWPEIERMLVKACSIYAGDSSVNGRMQAAGQLGPHTTHDAVSEMSVVEVFTTAYEGSLEDCSTILDVHYRLLGTSFLLLRLLNRSLTRFISYLNTHTHTHSRNAHFWEYGVSRARVREICGVAAKITQVQFARHGGVRRGGFVAHERGIRDDERGVERSRGEWRSRRGRFNGVRKEQRDVEGDGRYVRGDVEECLGLVKKLLSRIENKI